MLKLHNFLCVSQNIYQLHNFYQIRVSLFRPGVIVDSANFFQTRHMAQLASGKLNTKMDTVILIFMKL